jgi:hypothetical protein
LLKCAVLCVVLALGCGPCGGGRAVGGDTPFERCIARDPVTPPAAIGNLKLSLVDRVLHLDGLPTAPRIAFLQGPGMATQLGHSDGLRRLVAAAPDVIMVLGGIGLETKGADPWLVALSKLGRPLLFQAGGRDSVATIDAAFAALPPDARSRIVDVTSMFAVNLSGYMLALISGADAGGASIAESACGFSASDADAVSAALGDDEDHPIVLVSWEIPAGGKGARLPSASVGSARLTPLREHERFKAGVYAWPDVDVLRPVGVTGSAFVWGQPSSGFELVVPRIAGASHERADGTRQLPGFVVLRFEAGGIVAEMPR